MNDLKNELSSLKALSQIVTANCQWRKYPSKGGSPIIRAASYRSRDFFRAGDIVRIDNSKVKKHLGLGAVVIGSQTCAVIIRFTDGHEARISSDAISKIEPRS